MNECKPLTGGSTDEDEDDDNTDIVAVRALQQGFLLRPLSAWVGRCKLTLSNPS